MSDWSRDAGRRLQEVREARLTQQKIVLRNADLLKNHGPDQWSRLATLFKQKATDLNAESGLSGTLVFNEPRFEEFSITTRENSGTIRGKFVPEAYTIQIQNSQYELKTVHLKLFPDANESSVYLGDENGTPIDLDSFVIAHLESLLGIR